MLRECIPPLCTSVIKVLHQLKVESIAEGVAERKIWPVFGVERHVCLKTPIPSLLREKNSYGI